MFRNSLSNNGGVQDNSWCLLQLGLGVVPTPILTDLSKK